MGRLFRLERGKPTFATRKGSLVGPSTTIASVVKIGAWE